MIRTFKQAYQFILDHKICTVFGSENSPHPSLWDNTDLSEEKPAEGGWSPRVAAVWDWKTRIPQTYPDRVFYGKDERSDAVLMEMAYFRKEHFPRAYKPVNSLSDLAQQLFDRISQDPDYTGTLRKWAIKELGCTKSRFDTALKQLQVSLNVVRSMDLKHNNDFWIPTRELYLDLFLGLGNEDA